MERGLDEFVKYIDLIRQSIDYADAMINIIKTEGSSEKSSDFWRENYLEIDSLREASKLELTHFMVVNRSEEVIKFANNKIEDLLKREEIFRIDNKGFIEDWKGSPPLFLDYHVFFEFNLEVEVYNLWFKDASGIKPYNTSKEIALKDKHLNIFKKNGFILFDYLMNNYATSAKKTDVSYFYRKMETEFLKVGEAEFRRWIKSEYNIEISKIKTDLDTMDNYHKARQDNYSIGLEWFKSQSIEGNKTGTKAE